MGSQKGVIFLSCTLLIALAASLAVTCFLLANNIFKLELESISAQQSREKAWANLFDISLKAPLTDDQPVTCKDVTVELPDSMRFAALCLRYVSQMPNSPIITGAALLNRANFPQFNFSSLLDQPVHCANLEPQLKRETPYGNELSQVSNLAPQTCKMISVETTNYLALQTNLATRFNIQTKKNSARNYAAIVSAGYIDIDAELFVTDDSLVIAAGDIFIKKLSVSGSKKVTLISTGGTINVAALAGLPQLKLISWNGAWVEGQALQQENPLLPPMSDLQILGIR